MVENGTLMQYFEKELPADGKLWKSLTTDAPRLQQSGITGVWLPPAYKCADDAEEKPYDLYDLGEFKQKGSIRTKYGTKKDYIDAIAQLKAKGINVYADAMLNERGGADETEEVPGAEFNSNSSYQMVGDSKIIGAETCFKFPGRKGRYSDFTWNWKHFGKIDWDSRKDDKYEYHMAPDIDLTNREVVEEMIRWAVWYVQTADIDGLSLERAEAVPASFFREFLNQVRMLTGREFFTIASLWNLDVNVLMNHLGNVHSELSLIDAPLHDNFYQAAKAGGAYDLRRIFDGSLVSRDPVHAITFVDSFLTQPGGRCESWVEDWFKPLAYALILLRADGYPCIFYGDYKGISRDKYKGEKAVLDKLMKLRKQKAYGVQHDYFDDPDCIGWTREGDEEHKDSGMAVILSDGKGGTKRMYIGRQFAGAHFSDVMGNAKYNIKIDDEGCGEFYVNRSAVAVWVRKEPK